MVPRAEIWLARREMETGGATAILYKAAVRNDEDTLSDDTIQRVSLVDNVTQRLRAALLTGEIQPGEAIRVTAIQEAFRRQPHPDP